ncbi:MAG: cell division protein FtsZ [Treponema sp.]|nr:cell division protein FtsZ [Treponema sp.]
MNIFSFTEFEPDMDDQGTHERKAPADIRVIGSGSGGVNAVNHMIRSGLGGVQFIAVNTDKQHLDDVSEAEIKLHIGNNRTGGRGAGGDPVKGQDAANEDRELISQTLKGADMVFLTTGMGGGTGTGSLPVIAEIAKEQGALTVGVVTTPFLVEGSDKMNIAEKGIKKLRDVVDTLIVIPNQNLFKIIDNKTSIRQALRYADDILYQAVKGISDLITNTGLINTDFADVEATMRGQGDAHLGIGIGSGENRAIDAANQALDNRLLEDVNIEGATRLLVNIAGSEEFPMVEAHDILAMIRARVGDNAMLKFGITIDSGLGDNVKVTVIATGFQNKGAALAQGEIPVGKPKAEPIDFINYQQWKEMNGQREKRHNDNYFGILKSRDNNDNLDIPTAVRKYNPEIEDNHMKRFAAGGKDA